MDPPPLDLPPLLKDGELVEGRVVVVVDGRVVVVLVDGRVVVVLVDGRVVVVEDGTVTVVEGRDVVDEFTEGRVVEKDGVLTAPGVTLVGVDGRVVEF